MDLRSFEAAAAAAPPDPPDSPSIGYPTNGNPVGAVPATKPGDYWFYQFAEELRAVIVNGGLTPDDAVLDQLWQVVSGMAEQPLAALPYPTIATADNRLNVTAASAAAGGTVSVPADVWLNLGQELVAGETGRLRAYKTAAWQSVDLDASSTYYLRAQVSAGALLIYVQKGADSDTVPAGLTGVPDGASGGGFDSTALDILLAKVVTGGAASTPTVTKLANAAVLRSLTTIDESMDRSLSWASWSSPITINWARSPTISVVSLRGVRSASSTFESGINIPANAGSLQILAVREASGASRYSRSLEYTFDDDTDSNGRAIAHLHLEA